MAVRTDRWIGKGVLLSWSVAALLVLLAGQAFGQEGSEVVSGVASAQASVTNIDTPLSQRLSGFLGVLAILALAYAMSSDRKKIRWSLVAWGLGLQFCVALVILKTSVGEWFFSNITQVVNHLIGFSNEGARFVFGNLIHNNVPVGLPLGGNMGPVQAGEQMAAVGAFMAFGAMPILIFFSSLVAVLYHFGIMQKVVQGMALVMKKTMKISAAESLSAAANVFVGMIEAPLAIKPFVERMTRSELMAVATCGLATIAGTVLMAYVGILQGVFPDIAGHLLAASVMAAPAGLVFAKMLVPETEIPETLDTKVEIPNFGDANFIDAASRGAGDGVKIAINVVAMLIAFIALIAMANAIVGGVGGWFGLEDLSLQKILGIILWPIAWLMGVATDDCFVVGQILGTKVILNEFVAYLNLSDVLNQTPQVLSARSAVILTYALCGFANFGSIAVMLGGIGAMAPSRRSDLARLGIKAMVAATMANLLSGTLAGILL